MTLKEVGAAIARERERRKLSLRAAASELDCSASTLLQLERGENVNGEFVVRAIRWLGDGDPFAMGVRTGREMALAQAADAIRRIEA